MQQFSVNSDKPHFPVNSMRLFYLLFVRDQTGSNQDALKLTNDVVPRLSAYLDKCDLVQQDQLPLSEDYLQKPRNTILEIVNSATLEHDLKVVWEQQRLPHRIIQKQAQLDVQSLLRLRSVEHLIYARVMGTIISQHRISTHQNIEINFHPRQDRQPVIDRCFELMLQINDLTDAIVYAQQDIRSRSAKLLDALRLDADDREVEPKLRQLLSHRQQILTDLPLNKPTTITVQKYATALIAILDGQEVWLD